MPLVQLTMLGMGMPLTGFACGQLFGLPPEVATGLVLVGSCPGGVMSNVIAYLAHANVALSVTMTACSTLLSPVATPAFMSLLAEPCASMLPPVAMASVCLIIAITVAITRDDLAASGPALVAVAVCHNTAGFALGYGFARAARLSSRDARTVAIEVGIQNGGMATGLALNVLKSPAAALPAAVFGPWSAFVAALLATVWSRRRP